MAGMFDTSLASPGTTGHRGGRGVRLAARALVTTAAAAGLLSAASFSASAAPGDTASDTVIANVDVESTITLALDQTSFLLTGNPTDVITGVGAVTGVVTTNSAAGYSIGVQAAAATLEPLTGTNPDDIPIGNLEVVAAADGEYTPLSNTAPVITTTEDTRSALGGDPFSDDYQVLIPNINSDTYSVTLNYTATTLA